MTGHSALSDVLERILRDEYADAETGKLPEASAQQVRRFFREYLDTWDSPFSSDPVEIADFIYWNCESVSRNAAERWLNSLTAEALGKLRLGDVLGLLQPGLHADVDALARENEEERAGEGGRD